MLKILQVISGEVGFVVEMFRNGRIPELHCNIPFVETLHAARLRPCHVIFAARRDSEITHIAGG